MEHIIKFALVHLHVSAFHVTSKLGCAPLESVWISPCTLFDTGFNLQTKRNGLQSFGIDP